MYHFTYIHTSPQHNDSTSCQGERQRRSTLSKSSDLFGKYFPIDPPLYSSRRTVFWDSLYGVRWCIYRWDSIESDHVYSTKATHHVYSTQAMYTPLQWRNSFRFLSSDEFDPFGGITGFTPTLLENQIKCPLREFALGKIDQFSEKLINFLKNWSIFSSQIRSD